MKLKTKKETESQMEKTTSGGGDKDLLQCIQQRP